MNKWIKISITVIIISILSLMLIGCSNNIPYSKVNTENDLYYITEIYDNGHMINKTMINKKTNTTYIYDYVCENSGIGKYYLVLTVIDADGSIIQYERK